MRVQPVALTRDYWHFKTTDSGEHHSFDEFLQFFSNNPIKCIFMYLTHSGCTKNYVNGYFIGIEYEANSDELLIYYVTDENLPHGVSQLCTVTYNGKNYDYKSVMELYRDYQHDKLSKEIDEALE